jgi:hypothetical protein
MTQPLFALQARYQGTFIPGVTTSEWFYELVPVLPGNVLASPTATARTGPANAGLNQIDIVNVQWQPFVGAIGYNLFRQRDSPPSTSGTPWAQFTSELGVKDIGFPATTRS